MPRIARAVAPGFPHHVVQRGNNRGDVFFGHEDREVYLYLVKKYSEKWNTRLICYCLMTNHVHLLTRPLSKESLHKMMQGLTLCYTQHMNRKYQRNGRLWESRYYSSIIDQESYLWAVARYIEQNPVRAGIAENPEDYPYSSARGHFGLVPDVITDEDLSAEVQRQHYIEFLRSPIPSGQIEDIRRSTKTGRPLGTAHFVSEIENRLQKKLAPLPRGRPRKKTLRMR